jgi:hypothetical protein
LALLRRLGNKPLHDRLGFHFEHTDPAESINLLSNRLRKDAVDFIVIAGLAMPLDEHVELDILAICCLRGVREDGGLPFRVSESPQTA